LRAVCDTNVVISALIFGRRLAWLRNAWARGTLVPVVCKETTDELLRVLAYPKFRLAPSDRMALLEDYLPYTEIVPLPDAPSNMPFASQDPDDIVFIRLAIAAEAPLITGDGDLATMRGSVSVRLMSAAELWELVAAGN
jgi:uncharacterized protein